MIFLASHRVAFRVLEREIVGELTNTASNTVRFLIKLFSDIGNFLRKTQSRHHTANAPPHRPEPPPASNLEELRNHRSIQTCSFIPFNPHIGGDQSFDDD